MSKKRYGNELDPNYLRWLAMNRRCNNPKDRNYPKYGGRGIKVSEEFTDFKTYSKYINNLPDSNADNTIDRIDVNGDYTRGNLRWATAGVQIANQNANCRGNNTYTGVTLASPAYRKTHKKHWQCQVNLHKKVLLHVYCLTELEALYTRNMFIAANQLPHPLQTVI